VCDLSGSDPPAARAALLAGAAILGLVASGSSRWPPLSAQPILASDDAREGLASFLERRAARFTGR
jgi:hypothetical protein